MQGIHWVIRNDEQRANFIQLVHQSPLPMSAKLGPVVHPKSGAQIRYAHSLCNALAIYHGEDPEIAKRDSKVSFGVVIVHTSLVTGERTARLKSFSDYTKEEMNAFLTQMEVYLAEGNIPFTPSEEHE